MPWCASACPVPPPFAPRHLWAPGGGLRVGWFRPCGPDRHIPQRCKTGRAVKIGTSPRPHREQGGGRPALTPPAAARCGTGTRCNSEGAAQGAREAWRARCSRAACSAGCVKSAPRVSRNARSWPGPVPLHSFGIQRHRAGLATLHVTRCKSESRPVPSNSRPVSCLARHTQSSKLPSPTANSTPCRFHLNMLMGRLGFSDAVRRPGPSGPGTKRYPAARTTVTGPT